jgi:hypothetical protein
MTDNTRRMVPVLDLVNELGRKELELKLAGDYATAAGIRYSVVLALRLADAGEPSLDPSEPT